MSSTLMAHLVAAYPDPETAHAAARGMVEGGARYIEVQFPFSDPSADGPAIQAACHEALLGGFRVAEGFDFVRQLSSETDARIFIMAYASIPWTWGFERFCKAAKDAGAAGLIVPDLPPDQDEGLYKIAASHGLDMVPVLVTTAGEDRIQAALAHKPRYLYAALRAGITGTRTELGEQNLSFLDRISDGTLRVLGGFGISERDQVELLDPHVYGVVVGSAFVREITEAASHGPEEVRMRVRRLAAELVG